MSNLEDQTAALLFSGLMYVVEPDGHVSALARQDYEELHPAIASTLSIHWSLGAAFTAAREKVRR